MAEQTRWYRMKPMGEHFAEQIRDLHRDKRIEARKGLGLMDFYKKNVKPDEEGKPKLMILEQEDDYNTPRRLADAMNEWLSSEAAALEREEKADSKKNMFSLIKAKAEGNRFSLEFKTPPEVRQSQFEQFLKAAEDHLKQLAKENEAKRKTVDYAQEIAKEAQTKPKQRPKIQLTQ